MCLWDKCFRSGRRWEEHERSSRDASLWQRPMVQGSIICKDKRMSSFCGPHTSVMPRNCAFSHWALSRHENEMTAEKRTNRAAWVEEEKEPFADTARLVLQQYILYSIEQCKGWLSPWEWKSCFFATSPILALILLTFYRAFNSSQDVF